MSKKLKTFLFISVVIIGFTLSSVIYYNNIASAEGTQITVAGTIRNTGSGWFVIKDSVHLPQNIVSVKAQGDKILLTHSPGAKTIHSWIVTPDETMTKEGYRVGISGGTYYSYIYIYDKDGNVVDPNKFKSYGGNIWIYGLLSK